MYLEIVFGLGCFAIGFVSGIAGFFVLVRFALKMAGRKAKK